MGPSKARMRAAAKVNLFLRVLGRRDDGFHDLDSVFHAVDLYDDVDVELTTSASRIAMRWADGGSGSFPEPDANLALRAASAALAPGRGVRIDVSKRIPIGAGLGGGSADAAAVLSAFGQLEPGLALDPGIAPAIGSDVPFWLAGSSTAVVGGRGEVVDGAGVLPALHLVLGISAAPLSTADVYARWDEVGETTPAPTAAAFVARWREREATELGDAFVNDLEAPAFDLRPELADKKERLEQAGALGAGMTGSGPTLFALARDARHAHEIAARVHAHFDRVACVSSAPRPVVAL